LPLTKSSRVPVLHRQASWRGSRHTEYLPKYSREKPVVPPYRHAGARAVANGTEAFQQSAMPAMNLRRPKPVARPVVRPKSAPWDIWRDCRAGWQRGKFLFGKFGIADAVFELIVTLRDL
jgi:hypothetical protein